MLLPIKPICDAKKARRDGTSLIYLQYCYSSSNRTLLNSQIAIPAKYWDEQKQAIRKNLPEKYGNAQQLNDSITKMLRTVEDLVTLSEKQGIVNKGVFIKQAFQPYLDVSVLQQDQTSIKKLAKPSRNRSTSLYDEFNSYIASKEKKVSKATKTVFKNVKEHLQAFEVFRGEPISFKSFDYSFYESFIDFLTFD